MPFPVSCPACGKSFSIADDAYEQKIKGRVVSVKCKQCQALIRVDGTRPLDVARRPSNAPAEPGPAFLVDTPGGKDRELDANQIAVEIREGRMTEATLVWREGMAEWTEVGKVPELQPFLKPVSLSVPAPAAAAAPAPQPAEPAKKIRPMQPTLPMGMMAPPSLAARGITLPLNPAAAAPARALADETETRRLATEENQPAAPDDGFDALFGPSAAAPTANDDVVTSVAPSPPEAPRPARGSAPRTGSSPRAASSPMAAPAPSPPSAAARPPSAPRAVAGPAPKPASAPRASALPLPTPLPRPAAPPPPPAAAADVDRPSFEPQPYMAPSAFPAQATAPLPQTHPLQSAYPSPAQFPGNGQRVGSSFPTAPAPPGAMPEQSLSPGHPGPLPHSLAPALPGMMPQSLSAAPRTSPLPDSFPAAARIDDLEFRPKRGKGLYIAAGLVVVAIVVGIVAASGDAPKPVPVPTITPTAEPVAPTPTPAPTPSPTSPTGASDPLSPASPGLLPGSPPRTGSEFTDLFAAGAKKLEGKPAPSAGPTPPPSPLTPPP